jgi:adenylate cyclase
MDARFRLRGEYTPKSNDIVIVALDEKSRDEAAEIFQTRRGWAHLITALASYQPRAIGLDLLFESPEVSLDPDVLAQVRAAHEALQAASRELPPVALQAMAALGAVVEETRADERLASAITEAQSVFLGLVFHLPRHPGQEPAPPGTPEPPGVSDARFGEWVASPGPRSERPPAAFAVSRSLASISHGARGAGALNVIPDPDGNVRRVPGAIELGGRYYMPLGLAVALEHLQNDASYVAGQQTIRAGNNTLPVSRRGELMLAFLGPQQTFPHVSAADVLSGKTPAETLANKLVFVGFTDVARDKVATAFDPRLDGVEIHATLAHNILHNELLRRTGPLATLLTILILGAIITTLQSRRIRKRHAWIAGATALIIIATYLIGAHVLFSKRGLVVEIAAPVLGAALALVTSLIATLVTEGREKAQLRAAFSQYVSDAVIEQIVADPSRASLGGERRELTVMFSDIRGFSGFCETLEPEALSAYLNEYLTPMTRLVMDEGGMLDKYIGDAIMAVYGAPIELDDHAQRACRTALAMVEALQPLNQHWRKHGLPEFAIGIGVNSGPMAVGNMGSKERFDYTVLGDTVNLCARLEGLTKVYGVHILVGEATAASAGDAYVLRELDWVRVKGRASVTRIYELVGHKDKVTLNKGDLSLFSAGLDAYRHADWQSAETELSQFLERYPDDGPSQVLLARVRTLKQAPPATWDGVFEQVSK